LSRPRRRRPSTVSDGFANVDLDFFDPVGKSSTEVRALHLATVFGFRLS
jgi:hypothetical protein